MSEPVFWYRGIPVYKDEQVPLYDSEGKETICVCFEDPRQIVVHPLRWGEFLAMLVKIGNEEVMN